MKTYAALQKGDYHLTHCEDYFFIGTPRKNKLLCAVMDGCTMGTDSYFVSTLIGKLLRKITRDLSYKEFYGDSVGRTEQDLLQLVMRELFEALITTKNQLSLEREELLSTLLLLVIDKTENKGKLLVIGDGFVSINGELKEFDQANKPDYIGFHLAENFNDWYSKQTIISFEKITDISIATDGIGTFSAFDAIERREVSNPILFLMQQTIPEDEGDVLEKRLKIIEHQFGLRPTDDLALIRIVRS